MQTTNDVVVKSRNIGLVDALDRVLDKGVVVDGDIQLCVAGIELVNLQLKLLLASTATIEKFNSPRKPQQKLSVPQDSPAISSAAIQQPAPSQQLAPSPAPILNARVLRDDEMPPMLTKRDSSKGKLNIDPKKVEQGLAKLVLTIVELLRNLMEKQALRRVDLGTLKDKEIDMLGEAFMKLDEKMKGLKDVFGLTDKDLNLDLGPLGDLI